MVGIAGSVVVEISLTLESPADAFISHPRGLLCDSCCNSPSWAGL